MTKDNSVKALYTLAVASLTMACQQPTDVFTIEGVIKGGAEQVLYLEEVGTGNALSLDSVKLDNSGLFSFQHKGTHYPMYYRLRLGEASIPFAADSLTKIKLQAQASNFFTSYQLQEADPFNHQIKEIATLRYQTDKRIDSVRQMYQRGQMTPAEQELVLDSIVRSFKSYVASHYIYVDPKSPASYFALYQTKDNIPYFSIYQEGDDRVFAAIATAYELYYPEAPYLSFLKNEALKSLAIRRLRRAERGETTPIHSADSLAQ